MSSEGSDSVDTESGAKKEMASVTPPEKDKEKEKEDLVAKYKRLLAMARSSLESNQASLLEKDSQIKKLKKLLEEESFKNKQQNRLTVGDDESDNLPRRIVRYLDVDDVIHILVEYTGAVKDTWLQFGSEVELKDWMRSISGVPLVLPQKCLTVEESSRIEMDSKKNVDRIVEEFRRYKVRSEIARKQKDSEQKHTTSSSPAPSLTPASISVEQAMNDGTLGYNSAAPMSVMSSSDSTTSVGESIGTTLSPDVQSRINKETNRWKLAYESVVKENEQLRNRGGESLVAAQWRERFEICKVEKEELLERYKLACNNSNKNEGALTPLEKLTGGQGKSFQQLYIELKEEYKEFRGRVLALEKERERKRELRRNNGSTDEKRRDGSGGSHGHLQQYGGSTAASKHEYIKNLILQYLCCKDPIVRNHMEIALVQMFRFSDEEKNAIEERKKYEENYEDALLSSITNFVSSTFYNAS